MDGYFCVSWYNMAMELFIYIVGSLILAETTALTVRAFKATPSRAKNARRKVFIDTSTLMDGRILSVAKAGFMGDELLIPRSVIRELQLLADGPDSEKRARARFGLDIVNELERVELASVEIYQDEGERVKVDERLLELAKEHRGIILTNDFNLAKVAATEHIDAININDLAQGLRSEYLPGDKLSVKIISAGANPHQGVAHLPDGTMVVVDQGTGDPSTFSPASGGAGGVRDFVELFTKLPTIDAGLAASIFHFGEVSIRTLKEELSRQGIPMRLI